MKVQKIKGIAGESALVLWGSGCTPAWDLAAYDNFRMRVSGVHALCVTALAALLPATAHAGGAQTFAAQCSMCHQPSGAGLPGSFPRIAGRVPQIASTPDGRRYLAMVLLYGMIGPISVDGKALNGLMPSMGSMGDQGVADVLNHVLTLGKPAKKVAPFTAAEIAKVRSGGRKSASDVGLERSRLAARKLIP